MVIFMNVSSEYLLKLNNLPSCDKLTKLKKKALENDVPIIMDEGLVMLLYLIKKEKAKHILEIGTAVGYSAINMALQSADIRVDTIERDEKMYNEATSNISSFELSDRINVIFCDALLVDLKKLRKKYDLIFIDAAKAQYIKFFEKFSPLLKKGGIIYSDNLMFHGLVNSNLEGASKNLKNLVKKIEGYNEWLKNNNDFETTFFPLGDGVAVSVKR